VVAFFISLVTLYRPCSKIYTDLPSTKRVPTQSSNNQESQKKECVEKATDIDTLTTCLSQFPQDQRQAMTK
jgi:hypothetical protein